MPNAQHAWWSRLDACSGSKTSPDVQPGAATCAQTETTAVFAAFKQQMGSAGVGANALGNLTEGWTHWPKRGDVCAFLHEAETWDGVDRRWNNAVVVPKLREQLTNAITTDDRTLLDACSAGVELAVASPDADVNVSTPPPFCMKLKAFCVLSGGKEDSDAEVPPPWEDTAADSSAGCNVDGSSNAGWMLIGLVGLTFLIRRRR
jgi:MYXO-CTERM domain-containing protein